MLPRFTALPHVYHAIQVSASIRTKAQPVLVCDCCIFHRFRTCFRHGTTLKVSFCSLQCNMTASHIDERDRNNLYLSIFCHGCSHVQYENFSCNVFMYSLHPLQNTHIHTMPNLPSCKFARQMNERHLRNISLHKVMFHFIYTMKALPSLVQIVSTKCPLNTCSNSLVTPPSNDEHACLLSVM